MVVGKGCLEQLQLSRTQSCEDPGGGISGEGNCRSKGPQVGVNLACLRNSKDAPEARAEQTQRRVMQNEAKIYGSGVRDRLHRVLQGRKRT